MVIVYYKPYLIDLFTILANYKRWLIKNKIVKKI